MQEQQKQSKGQKSHDHSPSRTAQRSRTERNKLNAKLKIINRAKMWAKRGVKKNGLPLGYKHSRTRWADRHIVIVKTA